MTNLNGPENVHFGAWEAEMAEHFEQAPFGADMLVDAAPEAINELGCANPGDYAIMQIAMETTVEPVRA